MLPSGCHTVLFSCPWQPSSTRLPFISRVLVRLHAAPFFPRFPVSHPRNSRLETGNQPLPCPHAFYPAPPHHPGLVGMRCARPWNPSSQSGATAMLSPCSMAHAAQRFFRARSVGFQVTVYRMETVETGNHASIDAIIDGGFASLTSGSAHAAWAPGDDGTGPGGSRE